MSADPTNPQVRCDACLMHYRITFPGTGACSLEIAVVEILSYDATQILLRQPFDVRADKLVERIFEWLQGPVDGKVVFPPRTCREAVANRMAMEIVQHVFSQNMANTIQIEVPADLDSVKEWYQHFWGLDDTILINALTRSDYSPDEVATISEEQIAGIRLVGYGGSRFKTVIEARKRHNRLPLEAHYLLYRLSGGSAGIKPPE